MIAECIQATNATDDSTNMKIKKLHPSTLEENEMDLPITEDQYNSWQSGTLIQVAMPNLTKDQREFLITGLLPDDWGRIFSEEQQY